MKESNANIDLLLNNRLSYRGHGTFVGTNGRPNRCEQYCNWTEPKNIAVD